MTTTTAVTSATTTAVVSCATWVWLLASSTISVLVGLPFTTKVPLTPAETLAGPRPTRSVFSVRRSLYLTAWAREVAALWARITRNIEIAVGSRLVVSCQVRPVGSPMLGRPLGTGPRIETSWACRSSAQLAMIAPITATTPDRGGPGS
jgi:hypothetical protein